MIHQPRAIHLGTLVPGDHALDLTCYGNRRAEGDEAWEGGAETDQERDEASRVGLCMTA